MRSLAGKEDRLVVRGLAAFILATMMAMGATRASSFVVMGDAAPKSTPSIISLGSPAPVKLAKAEPSWIDTSLVKIKQAYARVKVDWPRTVSAPMATPSIIALGEPLPEVTYEKVSAIPKRGPVFRPQVIRGGISGDAFSPAAPPVATASSQPAPPSNDTSPPAPPPATPPPSSALPPPARQQ